MSENNISQMELTEQLIAAIEVGDLSEVTRLLGSGVDVNMPYKKEQDGELYVFYPLIHAAARDYGAIVHVLLAAGADVEVRRQNGDTALHVACIGNNLEIIRMLLNAKADVNAANDECITPLIDSAIMGNSAYAVSLLLQAGADVNRADNEGSTPLHLASLPDDDDAETSEAAALEIMSLLLKWGADVNIQDSSGDTPLLQCARDGFIEGVRLLLENNADTTLCDKNGMSPRAHAKQNSHAEIVALL